MILTPRSARRRGLSLLEVLLALAILVMSLSALGLLIDQSTDRSLDSRMYNTAARLAQSKMAEVEAGITTFDSTGGSFTGSDEGWQWALAAETQGTNLYKVTVTVTRDVRGRPFSFSLGQLVFDPTVKGTASEATRPSASDGSSP